MSTKDLLTHLQNADSAVPLPTLLAALSHHLVFEVPTPTPLVAAAISSPFFRILTRQQVHNRLQGLVNAFRHAVYLKHGDLIKGEKENRGITRMLFDKGVERGLRDWVKEALKGVQGGYAVLRLACCVGLLLGVKAVKVKDGHIGKVEDEIVIALAEVMDAYTFTKDAGDWEKEFQPYGQDIPISQCLIIASQSLPLLPTTKLKALPLPFLAHLLTSTISSAFHDGAFISSTDESLSSGLVHIPPFSPFARTVKSMVSSPTMVSMAGLSKLTAVVLSVLIDSPNGTLREANETLEVYNHITARIEHDWKKSTLSTVKDEKGIATETKDLSQSVWLLLKTLLFSTIMVADGVLGSVVFIRRGYSSELSIAPQKLAQVILRTLFHISFVVSQFGGVTATATGDDPGFKELRRVFYLAIDVLSSDKHGSKVQEDEDNICECFVKDLIAELEGTFAENAEPNTRIFDQAKTAYALACIEQLVPLLGVRCLKDHVWGTCVPYLTDSSHRETFESAHSVVLTIFASHAQLRHLTGQPLSVELPTTANHQELRPGISSATEFKSRHANTQIYENSGTIIPEKRNHDSAVFVQQIIPFYVQCLIENSKDDKLSTAQLRLAYAALVRSASTNAVTFGSPTDESLALAWYCVESVLDMIRKLASTESGTGAKNNQLHRLHLTLISAIASLPLPLMIRALEEIRNIISVRPQSDGGVEGVGDDVGERRKKKELVDALYTEILEGVGDREKEAAMRWWYINRPKLVRYIADDHANTQTQEKGMRKSVEGAGKGTELGLVTSRL